MRHVTLSRRKNIKPGHLTALTRRQWHKPWNLSAHSPRRSKPPTDLKGPQMPPQENLNAHPPPSSQGLILNSSIHAGIRAPVMRAKGDVRHDLDCGFSMVKARDIDRLGIAGVIASLKERVRDSLVYVSVDIDVLDPAFAPGEFLLTTPPPSTAFYTLQMTYFLC